MSSPPFKKPKLIPALTISERANELTEEIDLFNATQILRVLRQGTNMNYILKHFIYISFSVDHQIFHGWREYPSIYDEEILKMIENIIQHLTSFFGDSIQ